MNTTTTALTASATTALADESATLTATVTKGPNSPSIPLAGGSIGFYADGVYLASAPVQSDGTAVLTVTNLARGTRTYTAAYLGDAVFGSSVSAGVTVAVLNNSPVSSTRIATRQGTSVLIGVLLATSDADGDAIAVTSFGQGANGTVAQTNWGLQYTPNAGFVGTDTFGYVIDDGHGGSGSGMVTVEVLPADPSLSGFEDVALTASVLSSAPAGTPF